MKKVLVLSLMFLSFQTLAISTVHLNKENHVFINGAVTTENVERWKKEIQIADIKLLKGEPLYLIIQSPGGSIFAGLNLISVIKAASHPIVTVTHFAASMAFIIVQFSGKRYALPHAEYMSHRAWVQLEGQSVGELESHLNFFRLQIDYIESVVAQRLGINLDSYRKLIDHEYWTFGQDAVDKGVADEVVLAKCSLDLIEENKCPL